MRFCAALFLAGALACAFASKGVAQGAWVPPERTFGTSLGYNFTWSSATVESPEVHDENDKTSSHTLLLGLEYVPIERLAIRADIPFMVTRFHGEANAFPPHGSYDDLKPHATFQDLRVGARYQVLRQPFALAPHIGASIPLANYESQGYSAPGRDLHQFHFGLSAGGTLAPWLPSLYVHARYEFSVVEDVKVTPETEAFELHRSDLSVQVGYFISRLIQVYAAIDSRITHGGFDFLDWLDGCPRRPGEPGECTYTPAVRNNHDRVADEHFTIVRGGVVISPTEDLSIDTMAGTLVRGYNTRRIRVFNVSLRHTFTL